MRPTSSVVLVLLLARPMIRSLMTVFSEFIAYEFPDTNILPVTSRFEVMIVLSAVRVMCESRNCLLEST